MIFDHFSSIFVHFWGLFLVSPRDTPSHCRNPHFLVSGVDFSSFPPVFSIWSIPHRYGPLFFGVEVLLGPLSGFCRILLIFCIFGVFLHFLSQISTIFGLTFGSLYDFLCTVQISHFLPNFWSIFGSIFGRTPCPLGFTLGVTISPNFDTNFAAICPRFLHPILRKRSDTLSVDRRPFLYPLFGGWWVAISRVLGSPIVVPHFAPLLLLLISNRVYPPQEVYTLYDTI